MQTLSPASTLKPLNSPSIVTHAVKCKTCVCRQGSSASTFIYRCVLRALFLDLSPSPKCTRKF